MIATITDGANVSICSRVTMSVGDHWCEMNASLAAALGPHASSGTLVQMARTARLALVACSALAAGCGHRAGIADQGATVVSSSTVYLRNTFDTDPSIYVGRFIPAGVTEVDESNTMVLACSKHITHRFIDGGGVDFTEDLAVSTQVALKIGIPKVGGVAGGYDAAHLARAKYKLTGKIVAEIADPEAFAACCKSQPDQCTDRFVGEFIQGAGSLHHRQARNTNVQAQGTHLQTGIDGEGGVGRSAEWARVAEFPDPVYFAFKVNPTPYKQGAVNSCPSWVDNPPPSTAGVYVVGRSNDARSEQAARDNALENATAMAMQAAGVRHGARVPFKAESWCVTTSTVRRRALRYSARVLVYVTDEAVAVARVQDERMGAEAAASAQAAAERKQRLLEQMIAESARQQRNEATPPDEPTDRQSPSWDPTPITTVPTPTPGPSSTAGSGGDFQRIRDAVNAESFSDDKVAAVAGSVRGARLTAAEARAILDLFSFSADKIGALTHLRGVVTDAQNWQVIVDGFTYSSDRDEARRLAP